MDPAVLLVPALVLLIVLCILLVFRIPVKFGFRTEYVRETPTVAVAISWWVLGMRISWSGGPLQVGLEVGGRAIFTRDIALPKAPRIPEPTGEAGKEAVVRPPSFSEMLPYGGRFIHLFSQFVSLEKMDLNITIGLGRAADTGRLFGWYAAVRPLILISRRISLSVTPDFSRVVLEGSFDVDFRLDRPLEFGIRTGRLFLQMRGARN